MVSLIDINKINISNDAVSPLVQFIKKNHSDLLDPNKAFLSIDKPFCKENAREVKKLFSLKERGKLLEFIIHNKLVARDLELGLILSSKEKAVNDFEELLKTNAVEKIWQRWFEDNTWVLGTEFVKILEE